MDFEQIDSALVLIKEGVKIWRRRGPILARAASEGRGVAQRLQVAAREELRKFRALAWPYKAIDATALASFAGLSVWCAAACATIGEAPAGLLVFTGLSFGGMFVSWIYFGVRQHKRLRAPKPAR